MANPHAQAAVLHKLEATFRKLARAHDALFTAQCNDDKHGAEHAQADIDAALEEGMTVIDGPACALCGRRSKRNAQHGQRFLCGHCARTAPAT